MNIKTVGAIFILLFLLFGCNTLSFHERAEKKRYEEKILEDWKKDAFGCLGIRDEAKARYIGSMGLKDKSNAFVWKKLGKPDFIRWDGKEVIYEYFFNGTCPEGKLDEDTDFCSFNIYFSANKVMGFDWFCY